MSISQTTPEESTVRRLFCPQCKAALPLRATFCGSCGERVKRKKQVAVINEQDIHNRYRITTLVRRRPSIHLYFAQDTLHSSSQSRVVAIRDIDISGLSKEARAEAIALAQQEYDRLRSWHIPHILASMDMRVFQDHLFLISGMPFLPREAASNQAARLYTLQDFLQSGQGLPKEPRALAWVRGLCQTVERLHRQGIVPGDLDPYTIVLNKNSADAELRLMISWMPSELQKLLDRPTEPSMPQVSYFSAPEALEGKAEVRSDVYSLGALLYLLLTGTPPDESTLRHRRHLRSPREVNTRVSSQLDDCVMQALALHPANRFASAAEFMAALEDARLHTLSSSKTAGPTVQPHEVNPAEAETVRIVPLSQRDVARWRAARDQAAMQATHILPAPPTISSPPQSERGQISDRDIRLLPTTPYPGSNIPAPGSRQGMVGRDTPPPAPITPPAWKRRLTGILPTLQPAPQQAPPRQTEKGKAAKKKGKPEKVVAQKAAPKQTPTPPKAPRPEKAPAPKQASARPKASKGSASAGETSLLKQMQRLLLGQQQHAVEAAAIIETPMRVRPDQSYNLRLHIVGRDEPAPHPNAKKGEQPAGLSALPHGEAIQVEVRSVLQQGYTYILQRAIVTVPAHGYAAEVTIPMQPQSGGATSRRERLHVFFLDSQRRPIYEKPFVVEVFISPLVQLGREGHQVLTIPI